MCSNVRRIKRCIRHQSQASLRRWRYPTHRTNRMPRRTCAYTFIHLGRRVFRKPFRSHSGVRLSGLMHVRHDLHSWLTHILMKSLLVVNKGIVPDTIYGVMAPPTFHAMGIVLQLFEPLAASQTVALFTPQAPAPPTIPSAQNVIDVARATGCKILVCAPTFLEVRFGLSFTVEYEIFKYSLDLDPLTGSGQLACQYDTCCKSSPTNYIIVLYLLLYWL